MYDKERIIPIMDFMEKNFKEIEGLKVMDLKDLDDIKFNAASMILFNLINKAIDLSEEITRARNMGFPGEYKDFFSMLGHAKIIDEKTELKMQDFVRLRNRIAHRYDTISKRDIFDVLKNVSTIKDFLKVIEKEVFRK